MHVGLCELLLGSPQGSYRGPVELAEARACLHVAVRILANAPGVCTD